METGGEESSDASVIESKKPNRRCMFGCSEGSSMLRRFPVHDPARCQEWIDFFRVSEDHIRQNSLVSLRVCTKHFKEKFGMVNRKLKRQLSLEKAHLNQTYSKRPRYNSTGNTSIASSANSESTVDSERNSKHHLIENTPANIQNLSSQGPNRKLFVITQSDENKTDDDATVHQKRKMYLILENTGETEEELKTNQKITLIANESDAQTAAKIEKIIPELIQRIQNSQENNKAQNTRENRKVHCSGDGNISQGTQQHKALSRIKEKDAETLSSNNKPSTQKTVNLCPDFLFLMKMLPKLEAIKEPLKKHVKGRIENMLTDPEHELTLNVSQ